MQVSSPSKNTNCVKNCLFMMKVTFAHLKSRYTPYGEKTLNVEGIPSRNEHPQES